MIKKITILCVILTSCIYSLSACDSCASGLNSSGIGLLNTFRQNFIGVSWQRSMFDSSASHELRSKDRFQTLELAIRYQLSDRWSIGLRQPIKFNTRIEGRDKRVLNGISDTKLMIGYNIFSNTPLNDDLVLTIESSLGVKLPVGRYQPKIQDENWPENFNIRNGAYGYIFQLTSILAKNDIGYLTNVYYQYNLDSTDGYRFGNQLSTQCVIYYRKKIANQITLLPFGGMQYEYVAQDRYPTEYLVEGTGTNAIYVVTAVNFKATFGSLELSYNLPLAGTFSGDEVEAKGKIGAVATYFF